MMQNKMRQLNLNTQKWIVKIVDSHHEGLIVGTDVCRGCTWSSKQIIYFSNELDESTVLTVIIHELVHAVLAATQMSVPEEFNEEQVANFFALYGAQLIGTANELKEWALHDSD